MKKLLSILSAVLIMFSVTACNKSDILVYMPDGAPALALCKAMDNLDGFDFNVVGADVIDTKVSGKNERADVCVLPIDSASKLLGSGKDYQMLGTLTHGNFYFLSKSGISITVDNIDVLVGKTIGVLQLKKIPGLTFKAILKDNSLQYVEIQNPSNKSNDKVNLIAVNQTEICSNKADIYLVPSPMADIKVANTDYEFSGSLHSLYSPNGFPQAIIVAKKSVINDRFDKIKELIENLLGVEEYLLSLEKDKICSIINGNLESGLTPAFNKNNLTDNAIKNSSIKFVHAKDCKSQIDLFLQKIKTVEEGAVNVVDGGFYFQGEL